MSEARCNACGEACDESWRCGPCARHQDRCLRELRTENERLRTELAERPDRQELAQRDLNRWLALQDLRAENERLRADLARRTAAGAAE